MAWEPVGYNEGKRRLSAFDTRQQPSRSDAARMYMRGLFSYPVNVDGPDTDWPENPDANELDLGRDGCEW